MTEEYFNQLVQYYKETLTDSMLNEGSGGQARRRRRIVNTWTKEGIGSNTLSDEVRKQYAQQNVRTARILGKKVDFPRHSINFGSVNAAARELVNYKAPTLSAIAGVMATDIAKDTKKAAMKEKGLPFTPDAGHKSWLKWLGVE